MEDAEYAEFLKEMDGQFLSEMQTIDDRALELRANFQRTREVSNALHQRMMEESDGRGDDDSRADADGASGDSGGDVSGTTGHGGSGTGEPVPSTVGTSGDNG